MMPYPCCSCPLSESSTWNQFGLSGRKDSGVCGVFMRVSISYYIYSFGWKVNGEAWIECSVLLVVRMRSSIALLIVALCTAPAQLRAAVCDVSAYGAKGAGKTGDTDPIPKAIDTAAENGDVVDVSKPG